MGLNISLTKTIHEQNITHNLTGMADEAGIYGPLWRPQENGVWQAGDLIEPLRGGIERMEADPARFEAHNAENGWGTYAVFLPWLKRLLMACELHPDASVDVSV